MRKSGENRLFFRPQIERLEPKRMLATGEFLASIPNVNTGPQAGTEFGYSVDSDGDHLVVGAPATDGSGQSRVGAAYVFAENSGELQWELKNPTPSTGDRFGESVAISGDLVIVGDPRSDVGASDSGSVFVFDRVTGQLVHQLHNPNPTPFGFFGADVAVDGQVIVVGAYLDDTIATDAGAVYLFDATTGLQTDTFTQVNGAPFNYFGAAVGIDGNLLAISASHADNLAQDDGVVFVYDVTDGMLVHEFENPNADNFDYFGQSVAISGDRLVIGAHRDDLSAVSAGVAYVYDLPSGMLSQTLTNPSPDLSDNFGFDVDIDGDLIVVGAYRDDGSGIRDAGIAYQFDASNGALAHTFNNPDPSVIDYFGHGVAISTHAASVGAYWDDVAALDSGTVYRFDPTTGVAKPDLFNEASSSFDYFGQAVDAEGDNLVVGAPLDDTSGPDAGIVYIFDQDGQVKSTILNPDPDAFDQFGFSVAISGNILAVGAYNDDANGVLNSGSVYLFDVVTGQLLQSIISPTPSVNGHFGRTLSIEELDLVVGAPLEDVGATDGGTVYMFDAASGSLLSQIQNPTPNNFDQFGYSVSISGNFVAIGALADVDGVQNAGAAYVVDTRTGDLVTTLNNPVPSANDYFGESIALLGNRVIVGAPRKDIGQLDAGAAYLMDPVTGEVISEIENPVPTQGSFFGRSVDLASDVAVVGAFGSNATFPQAGGAYQFDSTTGAYGRDLLPNELRSGDFFGFAVAASEEFLVVGAPQADGTSADRGEVYIFDGRDAEPPVADAGGPYSANEGDSILFDASASFDLNQTADTLTYEWDFDYDGQDFDVEATGINPLMPFLDEFTGVVAVRVTDNSDQSSIATAPIVVDNVAPTFSANVNTLAVDEGSIATATGLFADQGEDVVTLSASLGIITDQNDGTWLWEFQTSDGPDDSATVTLTADDGDGGSSEVTIDLTVNNLAPLISIDSDSISALPGTTVQNAGVFSDPGLDDVSLTANVGVVVDNNDGTWSWSFADVTTSDSQVVEITATDSDGAPTSTSFDLIVSQVLAQNSVVAVDESEFASNLGIYDPPAMGESVTLTASAGNIVDNADGTWTWDFMPADGPDETQLVTITADYSTGGQATATFDLVVNNVAPVATVDITEVTVDEGQSATNSGTYSDAGQDAVTISASVGTIVDNGDGTWDWSLDNVNGPTDTQTVVITVEDEDTATDTVSFDLVAVNLAPEISVSATDVIVNEGELATVGGTYADLDGVTISASIGNVIDNSDGTWDWSWDTLDGPDDSQVVTVTIEDTDGATNDVTFNLTVNNAPPALSIDNALVEVAENADAMNTGTFGDPGADTVSLTASVGDVVDNGDGTWSWSLLDVVLADSQVVDITATDSDGLMHTESFQLSVFLLSATLPIIQTPEGQLALNSGRYSQPPAGESVTLTASSGTVLDNGDGTWSWGQGDLDGPSSTQVDINASYTNGAFASVQFILEVTNVAPQLTSQNDTIELTQRPLVRNFGTVSDVIFDSVTLSASIGEVHDRGDGTWAWQYRPIGVSPSTEQVVITAVDEDGGESTVSFTLVVGDRFHPPASFGPIAEAAPPARQFNQSRGRSSGLSFDDDRRTERENALTQAVFSDSEAWW